ncbi:30337_t:CDS:1, partial [Racocetra persica]
RVEKKELADGTITDFITYYRQYHKGLERGDRVLIFSFSQFDE